jgi:acyl carrier protein
VSDGNPVSCRTDPAPLAAAGGPGGEPPDGGLGSRLRSLVAAHLDVDPRRLVPGTRLGEDLCVDSLAAVELTMVIEDEFDISLPEEVTAGVRTYGDVLALVVERAGDRQA